MHNYLSRGGQTRKLQLLTISSDVTCILYSDSHSGNASGFAELFNCLRTDTKLRKDPQSSNKLAADATSEDENYSLQKVVGSFPSVGSRKSTRAGRFKFPSHEAR